MFRIPIYEDKVPTRKEFQDCGETYIEISKYNTIIIARMYEKYGQSTIGTKREVWSLPGESIMASHHKALTFELINESR